MADNKSFSISRKGYSCEEVEEYIADCAKNEAELRESYASLQAKYDTLFEENGKLLKEREQFRQECMTLAAAIKQLRDNAGEDYKAKYEEAIAQLEELKAAQPEEGATQSASPSQMIEEVAQVVKRVESDARRKAEAVTAAAKLEQTQAQLIRSRVNDEVKSLIRMLEGFVKEHEETEE